MSTQAVQQQSTEFSVFQLKSMSSSGRTVARFLQRRDRAATRRTGDDEGIFPRELFYQGRRAGNVWHPH